MSRKKRTSEFGKGLTYCLGLFLAHAERDRHLAGGKSLADILGDDRAVELWFNGSSDHLYDLDASGVGNAKLKKRIGSFVKKVLHFGHGFSEPTPKMKDVFWAVQEAKDLLREIDSKELGVHAIKGDFE
jgi:hypothetical protein